MNINEIKSWAKARGFTVRKKDQGYVWSGNGVEEGEPKEIEEVSIDIFNKMTDNKFVEYQKKYREEHPPEQIRAT